jgi:hypothetical protein
VHANRDPGTCCRWLGVDHIFLTDNNSTGGQEAREQLAAAFPSSFLSLNSEMEPRAQLKVYAWCAEEHRVSYNWIAFLDVDEYIVLRGRCACSAQANVRVTVHRCSQHSDTKHIAQGSSDGAAVYKSRKRVCH